MFPIQVLRWVALQLLQSSWLGFGALGLVGIVPFMQGLRPIASSGGALQVAAAWVFPAGTLGVAASLRILADGGPFLARLDSRSRLGGELGGLLLGGIYLQVPILAGALLSGAALADLGSLVPAILTSDLHLSGVALLLLPLVSSTALGASLFFACAWLVPALCGSGDFLGRMAALLDAGASLRVPPGGALSTSSLAAASALLLAGYLLRTGAPRTSNG